MRSLRPTAALLAWTCSTVAATARAETPIVLEGTIAEGTPRYFEIPFTVPAGVHEIIVRHDDLSETNILDWGLRDPARVRGWGGGNTEPAIVGDAAASRSYVAGAIAPGTWAVLVGQAQTVSRPLRYHLEIELRAAPTLAPQTERQNYVPAAPLATGPRWWAGDFHVHSRESGDAQPTIDAIADFARSRGLDFVELSEHNTVSQLDWLTAAQARHPSVLLLPGIEVTSYQGHANAIGARSWVEFRAGSIAGASADTAAQAVTEQGGVFGINHPKLNLGDYCIGCAWTQPVAPEHVGAVEIQNGAYSSTGRIFYNPTIAYWDQLLARGSHAAPLGGSDDHRAGTGSGAFESPIGSPTTMVYAPELSADAIVAAVRAGRTVVKLEGPAGPMVDLRANDALLGDTVRARRVTLTAHVTDGAGTTLRFVHNGVRDPVTVAVTSADFSTTREVTAPPGDVDDRWRCELAAGGTPRVVTGHLWIAATGEPVPPDAGTDAALRDAGPDASDPMTRGGGCGCRAVPPRGAQSALGPLAVLLLGWVRRRRSATTAGS